MGGLITSISVETIGYISFLNGTTLNSSFLNISPVVENWAVYTLFGNIFLLISSITKQPVSSSIHHAFYPSALADMMRPPPMVYKELPLSMIPPIYNSLRQLQFLLSFHLSKVNLKSTLRSTQ